MGRPTEFWINIGVLAVLFIAQRPYSASAAEPFIYQTWMTFATRDGLPHDRIRDVKVVDGHVWVATDGGLALLTSPARGPGPPKWKTWTKRDGLTHPTITSIAVDPRTHDVWLGSLGGGLLRLSGGRFDRFDQFNSGLAGDLVFSVAVVGDRVWAATNAGVSTYDAKNDSWDLHLERRADAPEIAVVKLSSAGPYLYAQSRCDRLRQLDLRKDVPAFVDFSRDGVDDDNGNPSSIDMQPTLSFAFVGANIYSATRTHVFRASSGGRVDVRSITPGLQEKSFVHCMVARENGEIWIGTDEGLFTTSDWSGETSVVYTDRAPGVTMYRGSKQVRSLDQMTIPDSRIRCITLDGNEIWVGTANGLARGSNRRRWNSAQTVVRRESATAIRTTSDSKRKNAPHVPKPRPRPGRDSVTIGCLVPVARTTTLPSSQSFQAKPRSSPDLSAVQQAVQQANARGGYAKGVPFNLAVRVAGYPAYAWGTLEDDFPLFKNEYNATAMIAALNPGNRIAVATALAMEMPVVNVMGEAAAAHERINPWMSRCSRTDPSYHAAILDYLINKLGLTRMGIVHTGYGEERVHLGFWRRAAQERGHAVIVEVTWNPDGAGESLAILEAADVDAVLTWSGARSSALLRTAMRHRGLTQWFVGSDWIVTDAAFASARYGLDRVIAAFPCSHERDRAGHDRFEKRYLSQNTLARRKGELPSNAYLSFDAAEHLIHAIRVAGLNPYAIQKTLRTTGQPAVARLIDGEWHRVALPER